MDWGKEISRQNVENASGLLATYGKVQQEKKNALKKDLFGFQDEV